MNVFNRETLILVGIALLLINIIIGAILRNRVRLLNLAVAAAACIVVIAGIAQFTLTPAPAQASGIGGRQFSANASGSAVVEATNIATSNTNGNTTNDTSNTTSSGTGPRRSNANGTPSAQNANGGAPGFQQLPSAMQTSIAEGTIPAPMQTRMAARGNNAGATPGATMQANAAPGVTGNTSGGTGGDNNTSGNSTGGSAPSNPGNGSTATSDNSTLTTLLVLARNSVPFLTIAGGLLILFAGMLYYASERERPDFRRFGSLGMLYILIGIVIVVTMVGLPMVAVQASGGTRAAVVAAPTNGPAPERLNLATATPTETRQPSATPSPLPTLTPTATETPIVLSTPVQYVQAQPTTATTCSVSAVSALNLRADPSTTQMAIGRIMAGDLLKVTGKTSDGQWWHVITSANVEGWVSAQFVKPYSGCTADAVPVVVATAVK